MNAQTRSRISQRFRRFCKTKVGEPLIAAKYPAAFNTGLFICGLLMSTIDKQTFRLGLLLMLLALLGYAVIFAYCQVPPDDSLFADHASRRRSKIGGGEQDDDDAELSGTDRKAAAPMRLLSIIASVSRRARGSISAVGSLFSPTEIDCRRESRPAINDAADRVTSYPMIPVLEIEDEAEETKPILESRSEEGSINQLNENISNRQTKAEPENVFYDICVPTTRDEEEEQTLLAQTVGNDIRICKISNGDQL